MDSGLQMALKKCFDIKKAPCPIYILEDTSRWAFLIGIALILLLLFPMLAVSASPYDFAGTVLKVSEPNSMLVNITESRIGGLGGTTEVLIDQPLPDLSYFQGKKLQFDILGHDILGSPVSVGYLNGMRIQDVYYCMKYPNICAYYGPYFRNELIGTEFYNPYYNVYESYYYSYGYKEQQTGHRIL